MNELIFKQITCEFAGQIDVFKDKNKVAVIILKKNHKEGKATFIVRKPKTKPKVLGETLFTKKFKYECLIGFCCKRDRKLEKCKKKLIKLFKDE